MAPHRPSSSSSSSNTKTPTWENKENKRETKPNWLELPEDIWCQILSKIKTIDIIVRTQKVCKLFRKICKEPCMFKFIDMNVFDAIMYAPYADINVMTRYAVDRSDGHLEDIFLQYCCDDDTLMYIAERSKNLKHLRLVNCMCVSDEGLIEAIKKLPMLEEVQLIICRSSCETIETVGRICPSLKSFSIIQFEPMFERDMYDENALAISKSMPQLRHLSLLGDRLSNIGLKAILDGCPLLELLDLRACFKIDLSGDLGKRCKQLKTLRLPKDSTKDSAGHYKFLGRRRFSWDSAL